MSWLEMLTFLMVMIETFGHRWDNVVFMLYDCNVSFQHIPNVISQCLFNQLTSIWLLAYG